LWQLTFFALSGSNQLQDSGNFQEFSCVLLIRWLGGIETPRLNVTRVLPRPSPEARGHYSFVDGAANIKADRCSTIFGMPATSQTRLERVLTQLRLYEHPLLNFSAQAKGEGVEVIIKFKDQSIPVHTYYFDLHPRDLDDPQFEWSFQRQLYDALHDYFVEMFIRTPQDRRDRQTKGL
jgi:hypothetical protein